MPRILRLNTAELGGHRRSNSVQAALLVLSMIGFLGLVGFTLAGGLGIAWATGLGVIVFLASREVGSSLLLRMYRARPLAPSEAPRLYALIEPLAARAELAAVPRLCYIPSAIINAFSTQHGGQAFIGLTDGLLRSLTERELTGVLAHEVGHIRHRDLTVMALADTISRLTHVFATTGQILLVVLLPLFLFDGIPVPWLLIVLLWAAPLLNNLLQLALSRTREFAADLEAARLTGDPAGLIGALRKLEYQEMGWFDRLFLPGRKNPAPSLLRTHPETDERIRRLVSLIEAEPNPDRPDALVHPLPPTLARIVRAPRWRWHGLWY